LPSGTEIELTVLSRKSSQSRLRNKRAQGQRRDNFLPRVELINGNLGGPGRRFLKVIPARGLKNEFCRSWNPQRGAGLQRLLLVGEFQVRKRRTTDFTRDTSCATAPEFAEAHVSRREASPAAYRKCPSSIAGPAAPRSPTNRATSISNAASTFRPTGTDQAKQPRKPPARKPLSSTRALRAPAEAPQGLPPKP
jgi:hypothetical protein